MTDKMEAYEGGGNVFADMGMKNADERYARALLGIEVLRLLGSRKLKQREAGALLGIRQSEISHIMNGNFSRFTTDKLLQFLKRLDQKVTIRIQPHKPGEPYQEVSHAI